MSPWPVLLAVLAALTMTVGNLCALRQTGVKRLLAYSSIGQAGYLLVGVAAADRDALAVPGLLLYLEVYLCMNLGAFLVVDTIERQIHTDDLTHFAGLGRPLPLSAAVLTLCLLSLAGFPSLGGFVGKTMLFGPALGAEWTWLAVVMGANVALSLFYYVRVCFVVILCQLRRNSLAPCPRDPGEFPCSTKECSFTLRRNTLPKVQIATYALPKNLSHILCTKQSGICLFPPFSWSLLYGEVARLCGDQSSRGVSRNFLPLHSQAIGGLKRIKTRPPALDRPHHPAFGKVMWRSGTDIRQSTAGPRTIVCAHGRESPSHAGAPSAPAGALGPQPGDTGQRRAAATMGRHRASRCRVMGTWRQLTEGKAG